MINDIKQHNDAFSLIELLVVIAIMATIIGLALPNFLGARSRAKDARRKAEMQQLKTALQLYNGDYHAYPSAGNGGGKFNTIIGCGVGGTTVCPVASCGVDFAAGPSTGCETTYMTTFPGELGSSMFYYSNGADFCLKDTLENQSDSDIAASYTRCNATCKTVTGSNLGNTDYAVCSE
jgi:prepilin-type N-terminal cleavage/methylation domain-containing protein